MTTLRAGRTALAFYNLCWMAARPALARNPRLADGLSQRTLDSMPFKKADVWIQAASAGESYLAQALTAELARGGPLRVHVTTNTRQGMDILEQLPERFHPERGRHPSVAFFPFDQPQLMRRALRRLSPRVVVLLETEIWPGLLAACREQGVRVIIVNGRLTERSRRRYAAIPGLWRALAPHSVLAVSPTDAARFKSLFPATRVTVMPNMKFDRIHLAAPSSEDASPLAEQVTPDRPLVVLGSVRREEETDLTALTAALCRRQPDTVIALFPRHLHRVAAWQAHLNDRGIPFILRSAIRQPVDKGVILWDTFGEINKAYAAATAAFVGGTLARLGGQNFLEPLAFGISPVIGPHWDTFLWVGREIVRKKLVRIGDTWETVLQHLERDLAGDTDRDAILRLSRDYIRRRCGGTLKACDLIRTCIEATPPPQAARP